MLEKETTEDIQKLGGSEALDEPYLTITLQRMIRKRAPWLVILFLSEMLTTTAMSFFEDEIAKAVVLALFLPLIISSGGNSGSQATTLIIRAMAVGEVTLRHWWRVMRREFMAGFFLGTVLGSIGFLRITLWHFAFHGSYGAYWPLVGVTIFFSLIGVVLWGTLSGSMLPFALRRVGLDPATCSAPFVATLVDVTGLIIYFTIAMLVLKGTLLAGSTAQVVHLGGERTTKSFDVLLGFEDSSNRDQNLWETKEVEFYPTVEKLTILVSGTDRLVGTVTCEKCGGPVFISGYEPLQRWPHLKVFSKDSEIAARLPVLQCQRCNAIQTLQPPWLAKPKN